MITREQIHAMLLMQQREGNLFYTVPNELMQQIRHYGQQDPNSDIAKALRYAAYARKEDVDALLAMLELNPNLLLQVGTVVTPGGDEVEGVTIYEFLLGAGDYGLAQRVQEYFAAIKNIDGEQERIRQYERYRPHIDGMLNQKPYDLSPLIELIKKATPKEIEALLNKDRTGQTELCQALEQFRKDWAPKVLTKPGMHYNYASLKHAFELLDREWDSLKKASGNNYDKIDLVWRQLIGFEMRRLPGIDRCLMAQGLYYVLNNNENVLRSYQFKNGSAGASFPAFVSDDSLVGLGVDFSVSIVGAQWWPTAGRRDDMVYQARSLDFLCRTKTSNLQNLCPHDQVINRPVV